MATFQLERGDAGYVFDGYNSSGSVNTLIKGDARYNEAQNTYLFPFTNASGQVILSSPNIQAPRLWLCKDTYFRVKANAFEYVMKGSPAGSQTTD
jgi:hypothetical protein